MSGYYLTALVCLDGHMLTTGLEDSPEMAANHCSQCGAKTISRCPQCQQNIRGYLKIPGVFYPGSSTPPKFCHSCGKPYPWTKSALAAAREYADELDMLTEDERELLKKSLDDLVRDTPQTNVAGLRVKKLMAKAGRETASAMRDIIVDVLSETAKKTIGL